MTVTAVIDPAIAVPLLLSPNEVVLLANSPGQTTLGIWSEREVSALELSVAKKKRDRNAIDLQEVVTYQLENFIPKDIITLKVGQWCKLKNKNKINSRSLKVENQTVAKVSDNGLGAIVLLGWQVGTTTLKLATEDGDSFAINIKIIPNDSSTKRTSKRLPAEQIAASYIKIGKFLRNVNREFEERTQKKSSTKTTNSNFKSVNLKAQQHAFAMAKKIAPQLSIP
jgi:Flp pilus assembly secretin CpaC